VKKEALRLKNLIFPPGIHVSSKVKKLKFYRPGAGALYSAFASLADVSQLLYRFVLVPGKNVKAQLKYRSTSWPSVVE